MKKALKALFIAMVIVAVTASLVEAGSNGKGKGAGNGKGKGRSEEQIKEEKVKKNQGKALGQNKENKAQSISGSAQAGGNSQATGSASNAERRRNNVERRKERADMRANRPEIDRGKSAEHKMIKVAKVDKKDDLIGALEKAKWSYNHHVDREQGNMGKPRMRDPYGHDKDSGREGSERGRPIRGPLIDIPGITTIDFPIMDPQLIFIQNIVETYQDLIQQYPENYQYAWFLDYFESSYEYWASVYSLYERIPLNGTKYTINYDLIFSPPEELYGTTFLVTTTLTNVYDYTSPYMHYDAGQVMMEQTQEMILGTNNTLNYSYDPPTSLVVGEGLYANLAVTITEPISKESYTVVYDKQLYLYRCPYGKVTNSETGQTIVGAKVTVHYEDGSLVPLDKASNPTAGNPQVTDATGRYGFKLQTNRKYYITATAEGYKEYKSPVFTEKWHVLREDITLMPVDEEIAFSK